MDASLTADPVAGGSSVRRLVSERGLAALVALAGTLAIAYTAYRLRDRFTGDATIYLSYARNAAHGHLFQFNVGDFSSGSTSPLWALLLGVPFLFGLGIGGAQVFAALFAVFAFLVILVAARELSRSWAAAAIASLFVLGTLTSYAVSLYESGLVAALSALALVAGQRTVRYWRQHERLDPRAAAPLVAVWAALPLARPDAVILVGAQAVALLAFAPVPRRRAAAVLVAMLAVAAIPSAAYFGYSLAELGTPSTSSAGRAHALREFAAHLVGPFYRSGDALREVTSSPWIFGLLPALGGLALAWRRGATRWLALYGGLALLGYVAYLTFVAPAFFDTPRYLLPVVPVVVAATACLLARARGTALWLPALLAALLVVGGSSAKELRDRVNVLRSFEIGNHEVFERDVGARIDRLARPGDVVLAYEVQLRYYLRGDLKVLSEDGITDGKVRPYQGDHDMTSFLRRYRPRWWIADENVNRRPYLRGSVLQRAVLSYRRSPVPAARTLDGIRFDLVARRPRPLARGFGGWQMLFRLSYPRGP